MLTLQVVTDKEVAKEKEMLPDKEVAKEKGMIPPVGNCCHC